MCGLALIFCRAEMFHENRPAAAQIKNYAAFIKLVGHMKAR